MDDVVDYTRQIRQKAEAILAHRAGRARGLVGRAALVGMLLIVFYCAKPIWAAWPRLFEIFFKRGFWPHVIILFAALASAELLLKVLRGWFTDRFDPEDVKLPADRYADDGDLFRLADGLEKRTRTSTAARSAFWTRRLALGLLQVARGDSKENVRSAMQVQAEVDEATLGSRYTLLKLYLWAIPLLGFIGTVEGIGSGIGDFSADLGQEQQVAPTAGDAATAPGETPAPVTDRMERVKTSLQNVTSGLGRAFDTTYLALVVTVLMMIATSVVEKLQIDRQISFDEFFQTHFVERLPPDRPPGSGEMQQLTTTVAQFQQSVEEARQVSGGLDELKGSVDALKHSITNSADALNQSLDKGIRCRLQLDKESE